MISAIFVCSECDQEYNQPGTCEVCLIKLSKRDEEVEDKEWSEEDELEGFDEEDEDELDDEDLGLSREDEDLMGLAEKEDIVDEDFDDRDPADRYM